MTNEERSALMAIAETPPLEVKRAVPLKYSDKQRNDYAAQMLAAIIGGANMRGSFPNAEMVAKEAVKYADALILELSK